MKRILTIFALCALVSQCTLRDTLDTTYFDDLNNVVGGEKPTAPVISSFNYPTDTTLSWSTSTDPDSEPADQAVQFYFVYYYLNSVPSDNSKYNDEYLLFTIENSTSISLSNITFPSGTSYFGVTGYDGGRESEISNIVSFSQ